MLLAASRIAHAACCMRLCHTLRQIARNVIMNDEEDGAFEHSTQLPAIRLAENYEVISVARALIVIHLFNFFKIFRKGASLMLCMRKYTHVYDYTNCVRRF